MNGSQAAVGRHRPQLPALQMGVGATVIMLFTAFTASFIVRRTGADWTPVDLPALLWAGIGLLVVSSFAVEVARRHLSNARMGSAARATIAAWILGLAFLGVQTGAWIELRAAGVFMPTNPHASFFYMITAIHGLHVIAGVIVLGVLAVRLRRSARDSRPSPVGGFGGGVAFWHLLGVIWVFLFGLLQTG